MLMKLVNGAQFLNITFSMALFAAVPPAAVFGTVIVLLSCTMHHYDHINLTLTSKLS